MPDIRELFYNAHCFGILPVSNILDITMGFGSLAKTVPIYT